MFINSITTTLIAFLLVLQVHGQYQKAPYAEWAHDHLVWMNAKEQNQSLLIDLVAKYQSYGIPVGAVNIDSLWSQCINTFQVNRKFFPNMEQLIKNFHAQGIRVIVWATNIVNKQCKQFQEGVSKKYFLNNGKTVKWWHGNGAFVDFFNPSAKKWFTSLMDRILDMGIDGWKCDGSDPLMYLLRPWPYSAAKKRYLAYHQYANQYYGTFYNYTLTRNPEGLIMSRPVDSLQSWAFMKYSPKYVMFMGWVGDQYNDVDGFKHAMINVIHSASNGYLNFGFDIGGYKTRGKTSQKWLFLRWVQVGSLLPFMQNGGGGGPHAPWSFDDQTVQIYKKFAILHHDLKAFFLTAGTEAYAKKKSVLQPITIDKKLLQFSHEYNMGYVLWNSFLVEPIFAQSGFVQVVFPKGHKWVYYFDRSRVYEGGQTRNMGIKLEETAFFIRSNSIIPIRNQLWLVYLEQGSYQKSIIRGKYSDQVTIKNNNKNLQIAVDRFYQTEQIRQNMQTTKTIIIRLIGVNFHLQSQSKETFLNKNNLKSTEYQNQFQLQIQLNKKVTIQGIFFTFEGTKTSTE